jgi:hypoxanthine phosphoribosyltransferase
MDYVRPSLDHINSLTVSVFEQLMRSDWHQDFDLYVKRGGHFVIRLLQDCYAGSSIRIPAYGVDSYRYTDLGEALPRPSISLPAGLDFNGRKVLIVDDVADEAATLIAIRDKVLERAGGEVEMRFLTLYKKPWAKLIPHYWAEETDKWINFPWEPYEILGQLVRRRTSLTELASEVERAGFKVNDVELYLRVLRVSPKEGYETQVRTEELLAYMRNLHTIAQTS